MESYINKIYTQKDVENFINNKTEESINLDFKRAESLDNTEEKKKEIAKDVSAFANSDGGIIIYGIDEDKTHKAEKYSFIDGQAIKKEWLEQIINSRIQRKIEGLIIDPVRIDDNIKQTIYIVKIPRSLNSPHQTSNKHFYKRYNFESVDMEEYEIRDLYNRTEKTALQIIKPKINNVFDSNAHKLQHYLPHTRKDYRKIFDFEIEIMIENIGQTIEKYYKLELKILNTIIPGTNKLEEFFISAEQSYNHLDNSYSTFSIPNRSPLFQNELTTICRFNLVIHLYHLKIILDNDIKLKLFYSSGVQEYNYNIIENYNLTEDDFIVEKNKYLP